MVAQLTESGVVLDKNNKIKLNDVVLDGSNYIDLLRFLLYGVKQPAKWGEIYEFMQLNNFPNSLIPKNGVIHTKKQCNWISL